ncbi:hypothetical protein CHS0354_014546 [Potamilus streckersoni]|uniref:Replication protein A OB domain-containing protein n=1 Tax=Potamilus streckersoni TaxID=2493646 RepID=A0AAE0VS44_9BIVA|nr:hypothetical protein CHS0354_014546 [Potamilus streckersoni]
MSTPQRFQDKEYRNWVKCSLALNVMKEGLHGYVDTGVKKLHVDIEQKVTSAIGGPFVGKTCGICTWKNIKKARSNPITWNINCSSSVCDKWLSQILAVHYEPNIHINWKNADMSCWPTDPYEIAKVYMPKGQDRTRNHPQELDAPAVLSLLKYCTWFRTSIPNVQLLSDLIDFRNEVLHSGELKVQDSNKDVWIDRMIQLLSDLNVNDTTVQSELNRIKCEDIDVSFRENEIKALQNLVGSKLAEMTGEIASLQNIQIEQSKETTKHAEEVKKSLQELKKVYDKMESFLSKNSDIDDIEITRNMTEFKKDIHSMQEELSEVKVKVLSLEDQLEKHKEETQLQFKGVGKQISALEEKSGNNMQLIYQRASGGATASSSSDSLCIKSDGPVDDISSLRPYQKRWKIRARVTNKSRITSYKKYGNWGQRINFTFADASGSINAVAFGETVHKFDDLLQEQKIYYVSNATIDPAKTNISGGNSYDMKINDDTNIKLCEEDDSLALPSQIPFNSVMIDKLKPGRLYDVIGVVKDHREKTVRRWNGVEVLIVDQSRKMVPLNLIKKDVENVDLRGNPVVAVKGAWLKNSHGHVYLKMMPSGKLLVNPADIDGADLLRLWFQREGRHIEFEKI